MKRFVVCGLSSRAIHMYVEPLFANPVWGELVGIVDIDRERVEAFLAAKGLSLPFCLPDAVDGLLKETGADAVLVTGPDVSHVDYILAGLRAGLEVICEKPMVIDCAQATKVLEAERNSTGSLVVTHNSRYRANTMQVKRWLLDGRIGRVTNVELAWNLDTYHGASFFWRWNRLRRMSGGLTVTKSCHHFDLVNWWLNDVPEEVFAFGARNFYGPDSPHNPARGERAGISVAEQRSLSPYARRWEGDVKDDHLSTRGGFPNEAQYPRDSPWYVFDKEIDIEDTYSAVVRYRGGATMSYSMSASAAWEGYTLGINGTHGRIETTHFTAPPRLPFDPPGRETVTLMPLFGEVETETFPLDSDGHGGSDELVRGAVFGGEPDSWGLGMVASGLDGAYAVAIGEAMWRSVEQKRAVSIPDLLRAAAPVGA